MSTGIGRECYFCDENSGDCSADNYGERVHCQMENSEAPHYGSDCVVGHTGENNFTIPEKFSHTDTFSYLKRAIFNGS